MVAGVSGDGFSVPVLVAAAAATIGWWVLLSGIAVARRPPRLAAAPTGSLDLPPEPPAVAGVLANGFEVVGETAPAVLLDLAARGVVDLDEVQPGKTICRVSAGTPSDSADLSRYERRVLVELRKKAIDGVVPTDALTTGPEEQSRRWHRALAEEIVADAQDRGLTVDRWPTRVTAPFVVGVAGIAALLIASSVVGGGDDDAPVLGVVAAIVAIAGGALASVLVARLTRSLAQLPTPRGRDAAVRIVELAATLRDNSALAELPPAAVKLWDRLFAYAAVFGAAPLTVALLPMGSEDDHRAWSRVGGRWRTVRVRYPRGMPPAWGKHPLLAVTLALFWAAVAGMVAYGLVQLLDVTRPAQVSRSAWEWVERGVAVAFVPVALVLAWCVSVLGRAVPDLWQDRTVVGEIIRARRYRQWFSSGDEPQYWHYLAVDDGSGERLAAWRVRESLWDRFIQGERVRADVTPRLGYVRAIEPAPDDTSA